MHLDTDADARVPVALDAPAGSVELLADLMFRAGASAVSEIDGRPGLVTLIGDLTTEGFDQVAADPLLPALGASAPRVLEDAGSNRAWRDYARIRRCGRFVLRPEWIDPDPEPTDGHGEVTTASPAPVDHTAADPTIEIVIEPGDAFGSGSHPTTRLCVEAVGALVTGGERVLDVGCGTGVLGVAAALAGASLVVAVDVDPEAVRVTRCVAERNGVASKLLASDTPLEQVEGVFDLVLANLLIPIVEDLGAELERRVAVGGHLVVSGVLVDQRPRVLAAVPSLQVCGESDEEGWMTLVFEHPGTARAGVHGSQAATAPEGTAGQWAPAIVNAV